MKKTKLMRAALLLLVLTLITSCFVGGTFAKYTTHDQATNWAHIAKFGVKIGGTNMFAHEYLADADATDANGNKIINSVVSQFSDANDKKNYPNKYYVVAPGTKGDLGKVTVEGTPEVAVNVKFELLNGSFNYGYWNIGNNDADADFYCPLIFKIKNGTNPEVTVDGSLYTGKPTEMDKALKNAINRSVNYAPGTDISDAISITWEWPFNVDDTKDTALGDKSAKDWLGTKVCLNVDVTVTQID